MKTTTKKKAITKFYATLKEAERYQDRLYSQYDSVKLVQFPRFGEEGAYSWEVSNEESR